MKKYILFVAFIAAASTVAALIGRLRRADEKSEGAGEESMISFLGV